MKLAKKILAITSIVCVVICVGLLIGAIFGLNTFKTPLLNILLSFAIVGVGSVMAIGSVEIFNKNKTISIITLSLLASLGLFALIIFISNFSTPDVFNRITGVLAIGTVFFNIIVSNYIKLRKNYFALQIITYIIICIVDILLTLLVCGVPIFEISFMPQMFGVICLIAFALICMVSIMASKLRKVTVDENITPKKDTVVISKQEYEELLTKIKLLEEENINLKQSK